MFRLVACEHCLRMFLPIAAEIHCAHCAPGHAQLALECAALSDAEGALNRALSRARGLKRFRDLKPPMNFKELLPWLLAHPRVRVQCEQETEETSFVSYRHDRLWFRGSSGLSQISCSEGSEEEISFDPTGFTVSKFRVEYQP
jgi:hypothetical protein